MFRPHKSRFWNAVSSRFRPKRQRSLTPPDVYQHMLDSDRDSINSLDELMRNHRDGFYKYSQQPRVIEQDTKSETGSLILRPSVSLEDDVCDQHVTPTSRRHSRPYTVSSDEWVVPSTTSSSSASQVLSLDDLDAVQLSGHLENVLKVFTRVYAIAKIVYVVFLATGKEIDDSDTGLFHWVQRAETEIRTDSLATMIEIVENLFYTLYSTIELEMACIELCALFNMGPRPPSTHEQFYLPDPTHLYRIFLAFKDVLDSPLICEDSRSTIVQDMVLQFQQNHVRGLMLKGGIRGFTKDDLLGYRRYALNIVSERSSAYCKKWSQLIRFFDDIPSEVMAVMSEKYFTRVPKEVPEEDFPTAELGFVDPKAANPVTGERDIIFDHRMASLAKLEGKSVGEARRDNPKVRLLAIVKCHKCICASSCTCAQLCTDDVERWCPCAERQLRLMMARRRKGTGRFKFATRVNNIARFCFEDLADLRRDVSDDFLVAKMGTIFDMFDVEIMRERSGVALNWI